MIEEGSHDRGVDNEDDLAGDDAANHLDKEKGQEKVHQK